MTLHFVDTSALIKRYVPEVGSDWISSLAGDSTIAISALAIVEVSSALSRRAMEGSLTIEQRDEAFALFNIHLPTYIVIRLGQDVIVEAATLLLKLPPDLPLRAADALQLASALRLARRARRGGVKLADMITADPRLAKAAKWAGLHVASPADHL